MSTEIISIGLPPLASVSVAGEELLQGSSSSGRHGIDVDLLRSRKQAVLVAFSKGVDEGAELDCQWGSILVQPLSRSQRQLARRRGWTKMKTSHLEGWSSPSVVCYYLPQRHSPGNGRMVICARPDTAGFMGRQPDHVSIADLALPGTHDTCAYYGYPVSQCQQPSTPLSQQLLDGVRFLDIRLQVIKGELHVYHGMRDQRCTFQRVLADLAAFLDAHPTETVIMSVKDEVRNEDFSRLIWLDMAQYEGRWFLENRVPGLGEVRGKAILLTRFWASPDDDNWLDGRGWRVPGWAAPTRRLDFDIDGVQGRLQDWYTLSSFLEIPEKTACVLESLRPSSPTNDSEKAVYRAEIKPTLTISFASASGFPLSPPNIIAKGFGWPAWHLGVEGVNSRLEGWLVKQLADGNRIRGMVPMDFYRQTGVNGEDGGVRDLLVMMNHL